MMNSRDFKPNPYNYNLKCIDEFVLKDHLLRKIDKYIDFSFIDELTEGLYCKDNGDPAVESKTLFKMFFTDIFME